jgi:excisionase family DNA binding protein
VKFEGESLGCPFLGKLPNLSKEYMSQKSSTQIIQSEKKYLSISESAEYLGVHPNTIRNWIKLGTLKAGRVGLRTIRIQKSDLDQVLTAYRSGEFSIWNGAR